MLHDPRHRTDAVEIASRVTSAPEPMPAAPRRSAIGRRRQMPVGAMVGIVTVTDVVAIIVAAVAAGGGPASVDLAAGPARMTILAAAFHILFAYSVGAQDADTIFSPARAAFRACIGWTATLAFLTSMGIVMRAPALLSVDATLSWWAMGCGLLCLTRVAGAGGARSLRRTGIFDRRSAIIGSGPRARAMLRYFTGHAWLTIRVTGCYDDDPAADGTGIAGGMADLMTAIRADAVDQVIIALPASEQARIGAIVRTLSMTPVRIRYASELLDDAALAPRLLLLDGLPLQAIADRPIDGPERILKALADRIGAAALLILFAPLIALIALAIRLDSPGPVFFRQRREGYNCALFEIWKFRTMRAVAAPPAEIVQACRHDPRITRTGWFLRRSSLDELPQLLNVLAGEMSLVGPRPHAPGTRAGERLFCDVDAAYPARHRLKPGITGWAQVCGLRGETRTEAQLAKRLDHDLHYISSWSLGFDLLILIRTATTIFFQRSAY